MGGAISFQVHMDMDIGGVVAPVILAMSGFNFVLLERCHGR